MRGDLSKLTPQQRIQYNMDVCNSLGLNWRTRPFEFITLGGKLVFYARRDAADQLRKINGISVDILTQETTAEGLRIVTVRATDKTGRADTDIGVVQYQEPRRRICRQRHDEGNHQSQTPRHACRFPASGCSMKPRWSTDATDDDLIAEHDPPAELVAHQIALPQLPNNAGTDWRTFGNNLVAILRGCENKSDVFEWLGKNKQTLDKMEKVMPKMFEKLSESIEEIKAEPT